jgi:hypothetical protein
MTCGKPLALGGRFCGYCGAVNAEPSSTSAPAPFVAPAPVPAPAVASEKRKTGNKLLWLGALGILVLIAVIVVARHSRDSGVNVGSDGSTQSKDAGANLSSGDSGVINVVKNGVLANYNTTTVGKAFEGTFQDPTWKSFVSPKGTTIVEFHGTVKFRALKKGGMYIADSPPTNTAITACINSLGWKDEITQDAQLRGEPLTSVVNWMGLTHPERFDKLNECVNLPVSFQFDLSADKETFSLAYIDEMFYNQAEKVMDFIYH